LSAGDTVTCHQTGHVPVLQIWVSNCLLNISWTSSGHTDSVSLQMSLSSLLPLPSPPEKNSKILLLCVIFQGKAPSSVLLVNQVTSHLPVLETLTMSQPFTKSHQFYPLKSSLPSTITPQVQAYLIVTVPQCSLHPLAIVSPFFRLVPSLGCKLQVGSGMLHLALVFGLAATWGFEFCSGVSFWPPGYLGDHCS
jgi:hypothetical protein